MKKIYVLVLLLSSSLLLGCFHKKEQPLEVTPPLIKKDDVKENNQDEPDVATWEMVADPSQPRDEFDENGEFDPTKFQDEDIDEVMQLLKELTTE